MQNNPNQPSMATPIQGVAGNPPAQNILGQTQAGMMRPPISAPPAVQPLSMADMLAQSMQQRQQMNPDLMRQAMTMLGPQGPQMASSPTVGQLMQPVMRPQAGAPMVSQNTPVVR